MRMSTKRKILKYDYSEHFIKTCVEQEENLFYDAQKIFTYKSLLFACWKTGIQLSVASQYSLWRQKSPHLAEQWILSPEVQRFYLTLTLPAELSW